MLGVAANDKFGHSVSMSLDRNAFILGALQNGENGKDNSHIKIFTFAFTTKSWNKLRKTRLWLAKNDSFGMPVALSSDGRTISAGASFNDYTRQTIGNVRMLKFSIIKNKWDQLGSTVVGEESDDEFRHSMLLSTDGRTIDACTQNNDDNGLGGGLVKIFSFYSNEKNWINSGTLD